MTQDLTRTDGPVSVDPAHVRHALGLLAGGVTVITTRDGDLDRGMTAGPVTSLSVEPPLLLACLADAAPMSAAVARTGRFVVNVLARGDEDIAQQFAAPGSDGFRGVELRRTPDGLPMLGHALARLGCEVTEEISGATHTIVIGHVVWATAQEGRPLTGFPGGFGRVAFVRDDAVHDRLREMVLNRVFAAGAVLDVADLAERLQVEHSTVFYALTRLSVDALVLRDPDRGYVVTPFEPRACDEAFDARLAIQLGVLELCLDTVTDAEVAELERRFAVMARLLVGDRFVDFHAYLHANHAFHEGLVDLARSAKLTAAFGRLGSTGLMTRSFGAGPETSLRFIAVQGELLDAVRVRDGVAAAAAAAAYCALAKDRVREILAITGGRL